MKIFFLATILFLTIQLVSALELKVPDDLKSFVELSFRNYPNVGEMNDLVSLNELKVGLGKTAFLPTAMGDLSYRLQYPTPAIQIPSAQGTFQEIRIQRLDNYNAGISIAQPLIDFWVHPMLNKAKSDLDLSKDNLEGFKITLAYQVAQIYYAIIFLNKSLEVQQEQINLLQSTLQQIGVKVKNGDALNYDLVSTQVKFANASNIYTDLKGQLDRQYNLLGMLTGTSGTDYLSETSIQSSAFNMATDSVSAVANRNNPDIRIAGDKIRLAGWDIISADRLRLPLVNLQTGLGY